jgi:hypothetical protein
MMGSRLSLRSLVLHCDKASWFRHIEASTIRFAVPALIVSGDNGLNDATEWEGPGFRHCKAHQVKLAM